MNNVFSHLLKLPVSYFEKRFLGDIVSRFRSITIIQETLTSSFVEAILDGVMTFATCVMMVIYSPLLTAIVVTAVVLYGVLRWVFYSPLWAATEEEIIHDAKQQSHFLETIRGAQGIKLFGRETERQARWLNLVVDTTNASLRKKKLGIGFRATNSLLFGVERILIIWIGILLVLDNVFSIGMLLAFMAYQDQFVSRVSGLIDKGVELKMLQLQGERLADIVLTPPEEENALGLTPTSPLTPMIEVKNVSFRYADTEPYVLENCSLTIGSGESVAIVGASGCGKTTLLKLMLGILVPTEGRIDVGGVDIAHLGLTQYRQMVGAVMQDDPLFAGSIADNICFFDPTPNFDHIESCAKLAAIHDDIMQMSMAYGTLIGDMGTALSGGQKQRVLLARALYKQPQILFLDEATSHLDIEHEQAINRAIKNLRLTRVIIAHRPETIASAERVIRLHDGKSAPVDMEAGQFPTDTDRNFDRAFYHHDLQEPEVSEPQWQAGEPVVEPVGGIRREAVAVPSGQEESRLGQWAARAPEPRPRGRPRIEKTGKHSKRSLYIGLAAGLVVYFILGTRSTQRDEIGTSARADRLPVVERVHTAEPSAMIAISNGTTNGRQDDLPEKPPSTPPARTDIETQDASPSVEKQYIRNIVTVQVDDTLEKIILKEYGRMDARIRRLILSINPNLTDVDELEPNQHILLPAPPK
jgi:ABC-type multidrug transport system fused ATPase/permease subunit